MVPETARVSHEDLLAEASRLLDAGAFAEAVTAYEQVIVLAPSSAEAHFKLGRALAGVDNQILSEQSYRQALVLQPTHPEAANNLGAILSGRKEFPEAERLFRLALAERVDYFEPHFNLGCLLLQTDRFVEARYFLRRALALDPASAPAADQLGIALMHVGRLQEAIQSITESIEKDSNSPAAWCHLAACRLRRGDYEASEAAFRAALAASSKHFPAWQGLLLMLNYVNRAREEVFALHCAFGAAMTEGKAVLPHSNSIVPGRRLRIGFVSGDFRRHSVSYFVFGCLSRLSRSEFELWAYFNHPKPDVRTADFKSLFYGWRDIDGRTDADVAQQIREDGIDILVDLSGHTSHNRLAVFAEKPAPIQVGWIGYPNTSGLPQIDYRVTDAYADPEGEADAYCVEKLWRLPSSFLCYLPPESAPPVADAPCLSRGHVTFGSFNNRMKVGDDCLALWAKVLHAVPDSHLLLKSIFGVDELDARNAMLDHFETLGIARDRIRIELARNSQEEHLAMYGEVDIALDTYPYHGTTTTCEALWMGVPVVSRAGDRHASRVGVSLLNNAGLADLVAESDEQFVEIAAQLAADFDTLNTIRGALRDVVKGSRLTDESAMAHDLSDALRRMWGNYCEGLAGEAAGKRSRADGETEAPCREERLVVGGQIRPEGWLLFAAEAGEQVDFSGDLSNLSRFGTDSYSEVYCAHVLQRQSQADVVDYLKDLHRILRPGGKLYLSVPDLDTLAWLLCSPLYTKADKFLFMRTLFGQQKDLADFNLIGLNGDFVTDFLRLAGFSQVSRVASFGLLDDLSEYQVDEIRVALNLIAVK